MSHIKALGPRLLAGQDASVIIGEYVGRGWRIEGRDRSILEINGPLALGFEESGNSAMHAALGPFPNLLIVGDALFAGGAYLARFAEHDQKWHLNEAQPWSAVVVASIESPQNAAAERARMIAEAAYYRAEKRGFKPGGELEDWLGAELHAGDIGSCLACQRRWLLSNEETSG